MDHRQVQAITGIASPEGGSPASAGLPITGGGEGEAQGEQDAGMHGGLRKACREG